MTAGLVPAPGPAAAALPAGDPVRRLIAAWLLSTDSSHTRRAYRADLEQFADWLAGHDVPLLAVTRGHVDAFSAALEALAAARATIARKVAAISSFYAYAARCGRAAGEPCCPGPPPRDRPGLLPHPRPGHRRGPRPDRCRRRRQHPLGGDRPPAAGDRHARLRARGLGHRGAWAPSAATATPR